METIIFDGHNLAIRCGRAPHLSGLATQAGEPTGEAFGVLHALATFRKRYAGQRLLVVWEGSSQHRRAIYPGYKIGKHDAQSEFGLRFLKEALPSFGVEQAHHPQEEADDVIATLIATSKDPSERFVIVSTDHDYWQLLSERVTLLIPPSKSGGEEKVYDPTTLASEYGVSPERMVDVRAIAGDVSDCIDGIMGFGLKHASKAIREYGDLDGLYASDMAKLGPTQRSRIRTFEERVRRTEKLMKLRLLDGVNVVAAGPDRRVAEAHLRRIGANQPQILDAFFPAQLNLLG